VRKKSGWVQKNCYFFFRPIGGTATTLSLLPSLQTLTDYLNKLWEHLLQNKKSLA